MIELDGCHLANEMLAFVFSGLHDRDISIAG